MSQTPQLLDKHDKKIDPTTAQADAQPAGSMDDGLAKVAIVGKEMNIVPDTPHSLDKYDEKVDPITSKTDAAPVGTDMSNGLSKAAVGAVVGAFVGIVAGALANKRTAHTINHTIKSVGNAVKGAAQDVNNMVKGVPAAGKGTSESLAKGVSDTVIGVTDQVKDGVKDAKPAINQSVESSEHQHFKLYEERLIADKKQVKTAEVSIRKHIETQTAYISVPLKKERLVVEQFTPAGAGTSAVPGEANFCEGEIARVEVYEETPNVQKLAFVREEVSIRKEVAHNTVEFEDKIRREELYLDSRDPKVTDKTKI